MPTYEYQCENCGHKFEKLQTMSAKPLKKCPECKKNKLNKLISAGVFIKGGANPYEGLRPQHIRLGATNKKPK